jgi:hypothetical protein
MPGAPDSRSPTIPRAPSFHAQVNVDQLWRTELRPAHLRSRCASAGDPSSLPWARTSQSPAQVLSAATPLGDVRKPFVNRASGGVRSTGERKRGVGCDEGGRTRRRGGLEKVWRYSKCQHSEGCSRQPAFGVAGALGRYCALHRLASHSNLKSRQCAWPGGCHTTASYGPAGSPVIMCGKVRRRTPWRCGARCSPPLPRFLSLRLGVAARDALPRSRGSYFAGCVYWL